MTLFINIYYNKQTGKIDINFIETITANDCLMIYQYLLASVSSRGPHDLL